MNLSDLQLTYKVVYLLFSKAHDNRYETAYHKLWQELLDDLKNRFIGKSILYKGQIYNCAYISSYFGDLTFQFNNEMSKEWFGLSVTELEGVNFE